jgi:glycosyltransferase involved in cell wall biosynthesis
MLKVLFIASEFPPKNSAGVFRTLRFVRYLPELGWVVHVLTLDPRWYEPGSSIDEGLLERVPREVVVHRSRAAYPLHWQANVRRVLFGGHAGGEERGGKDRNGRAAAGGNGAPTKSFFQRFKDLLSVPLMTPDGHIGWIPFAVRAGKPIIRSHGIDALCSSGPSWTNHLVGLRLTRATGKPWVADFRDPWVGSDFKPFRRSNTWVGRRHQQLERQVVETADRVILNTPRSLEDMACRYGDPLARKFTVIPNGFDPADYEDLPPALSPSTGNKLVLAHAGSFYGKRNVRGLIQAIGNLRCSGVVSRENFELRLIGAQRPGRADEQEQVAEAGLEGIVTLTPRLPHGECLRALDEADVLLLVQVGAPLSVPGKVYEYIALGKPVFALANEGATTDLVRQENLGVWADPNDLGAIERAIQNLMEQLASSGQVPGIAPEARDRYDGRRLTAQLGEILKGLVAAQAAGSAVNC